MKTHISILLLAVSSTFVGASERPNIILIFADDLGYGDVGCFNEKCKFETPVLDQMANAGAQLTNFYVPTPYCAPSRATILTGRYPFRHTMMSNPAPDAGHSNFGLPQSEITIAEALKTVGYATAAFGKWHLGHKKKWLPRTQGFDEYYGILYSNDMFPVQLIHNEKVVEYPVLQATLTERYTERAIQFIEKHKDDPFFLYLPHAMPHKPLAASDDFYTSETPDNLYADVIKELDTSIGEIFEKLKQLKIDDNTIVIFTSDNGPWYGGSSGGLRGMKGTTWDGGLRVPMIVRWPGHIPAGIVNHAPTATIDVFPTLCKIAGVPLPTDRVIDGRDIMPVLTSSKATSPHDAIYGMRGTKLAMIRSGKWKLHVIGSGPAPNGRLTAEQKKNWLDPRGPDGVAILAQFEQAGLLQHPGLTTGDGPRNMMLFDLDTDRGEQHDVASDHPQVVAELLAKFQETARNVPKLAPYISDYLFRAPAKGQRPPLMRLIGGDLNYDRVPKTQQHFIDPTKKVHQP